MGSAPFSALHLASVICLTFILATISTAAFKLPQNDRVFENLARSANDIEIKFQKSLSEKEVSGVVCIPGQLMFLFLLCSEAHAEKSPECAFFFNSTYGRSNALEDQNHLGDMQSIIDYLAISKIDGTYAAFADKRINLNEKFLSQGKDLMDITVNQIDFKEKSKAVKVINSWFSDKTGNLFKNVIKKDDLDGDTKLMFLGALTFKDKWEKPFNPTDTREDYFHVSETEKIKVKFMTQTNKFLYANINGNEILILPLKESGYSMFLLLSPDIQSEKRLSGMDLSLMQFKEELVELTLPKFQIETSKDFEEKFTEFFASSFDSSANFSRITDLPIKASNVIQNIHFKVDEQGTGATGASEFELVHKLSGPNLRAAKQFKVNKPFSFHLQEMGSFLPSLFVGIIRRPQVLE